MARADASAATPPAGLATRTTDLVTAFAVGAAVLVLHVATGLPALADNGGDNDSMLRLVQIRALLDGQGWFDLQQYRMGLERGFPLHWSRLVDLPIALLILAAGGFGLSASGPESFALTAWPAMLFVAALFLIIHTVRRLGSEAAVLPAVVLATAALYFTGEFDPGAIDHHNIQLVLVLAMLNRMAAGSPTLGAGLAAGAFAALSIGIGMETAPYVAVAVRGPPSFSGLRTNGGPLRRLRHTHFFGVTGLSFLRPLVQSAWSRGGLPTRYRCSASFRERGLGLALVCIGSSGGLTLGRDSAARPGGGSGRARCALTARHRVHSVFILGIAASP